MTTNSKIKINLDSLKSRREWKRHKVKDGHNIFRILPPFGDASNGYPYRKWQIVWGLVDPESGRARPFASSMTSEKRCPVTEYVATLKKRAESLKANLQATGASEENIKTRLQALNNLINDLAPKTVYVYNAVDKSGEVGLLELKSTAHKKMKAEMNKYIQDYNQDPTSLGSADDDSGVWFDITRQGQFRDTEYDVLKCQIKTKNAAGKIAFEDDRSALQESVVQNFDNLAYDLSSIYQVKTFDELQEILLFNLANIVELVPDANLDVEPSLELTAPVATATKTAVANGGNTFATSAKPTAKVTTKIDDGDDDEEGSDGGSVANGSTRSGSGNLQANATLKKTSSVVALDDDFLAQADAILNG